MTADDAPPAEDEALPMLKAEADSLLEFVETINKSAE